VLSGPNEVFVAGNLKFKLVRSQKNLLGFAVGKKFGGAVERNKFKRRCRSFFVNFFQNKPYVYLVVFPLKPLVEIKDVRTDFLKLRGFLSGV